MLITGRKAGAGWPFIPHQGPFGQEQEGAGVGVCGEAAALMKTFPCMQDLVVTAVAKWLDGRPRHHGLGRLAVKASRVKVSLLGLRTGVGLVANKGFNATNRGTRLARSKQKSSSSFPRPLKIHQARYYWSQCGLRM